MKKGRRGMSSSTSPLLLLLLLLLSFLSFSFAHHHDQPTCSNAFTKLMKQQKGNITMCKKLRTLGAEFAWSYNQNDPNSSTHIVDVLFGARLIPPPPHFTGWLAWGVNPGKRPEMIGTEAIIGVIPTEGSQKVDTYKITKETRIGCHLSPATNLSSGLRFQNLAIAYDTESKFYTLYARLFLPSNPYNVSRLNHVWQIGYDLENNDPKRHPTTLHNVDSTETIDLTSGEGRSTGQYRSYLRRVHGVLNIVGWGTLLPMGVIIARYFRVYPIKCDKWWFYLHLICQSAGFLIGTAGWGMGLWLGHASKYYTFQTHRIYAIFIFVFTTIQMLALRLRPKESDDYRKYWNMYHHFLGYGLLVTIFINIFKGISILKGGEGWRWAYVGILSLLGAITFLFELFTWVKFCFDLRKKASHSPATPGNADTKPNEKKNEGAGGGKIGQEIES